MEREVEQLRSLVEDLFMKIESLENRVSVLEDESAAKPTGPEPILTCVQCQTEYKESENAEGHCKYHTGTLKFGNWKATYNCCNASAGDREKAKCIPGCTKGKHRSKHHTDYVYSSYFFHMSDLSNEAKEMWLVMDVRDVITDSCEWGEVGLSSEGKVFVVVGSSRIQPVTYSEFTMAELKKCKKPVSTLFEKKDPAGWCMKAELHASGHTAQAIAVSLKPAGYKSPLVKTIQLVLAGDSFRPGTIECVSDPTPSVSSVEYSLGEKVIEGPTLEAGEDYSVDRKTDYPTVTNDDMFALELKQVGQIEVNSSFRVRNGKWNNLFSVTVKVINGNPDIVSISEVYGEYMNKDGQWIKCDDVWLKPSEAERFLERRDFLVDGAAPLTMTVQVAIAIDGPEPDSWATRARAHYSLPQPLHLRVTFVDQLDRTASLRFEQGNLPLDLPTHESREKSWSKKRPMLFYLYADDVEAFKRSDIAIYYDDNGVMVYRPAPNDQSSTSFYLRDDILIKAAYEAQKSNESMVELTSLKKENKGSVVQIFAMVDLDKHVTYGVKVVIVTPTSKAEGFYNFPRDDFSSATISTDSDEVTVNSKFTVNWTVPRASKNDKIELYSKYGSSDVSRGYNKQAATEGDCQMKAPMVPGLYEVRYYPSWLSGTYTGLRHATFVAVCDFRVIAA